MNQSQNIPLASNKKLILATVVALAISTIVYFTVILPAEYNIDPTGIGKNLGLTVLSDPETTEINTQNNIQKPLTSENTFEFREDRVLITVPAQKGVEYKFNIKEFGNLIYEWETQNNSDVYFDFHGEPAGDTTGYFESFTIATTNKMKGSATVPFEGSHGWYWKNSSNQDLIIELKTSGNYQVIGLKQ